MANRFLKSKVFNSIKPIMPINCLNKFDKYSSSITNKYTSAKEIWTSMCSHFEGKREEVGELYSNMEDVESKEESSTSGKTFDESIHGEHEQNHLCLMGHEQEVSNSNSNNDEFTFEELQDAFHDLHDELEKMILKNKALKKQISTLSKIDLNENVCKKCDDFQKENNILKEEILDFEMEKDCFFKKNSSLEQENISLKEKVLLLEKENLLLKKKNLNFEKNSAQNSNFDFKKNSFQNKVFKRNDSSKKKNFEKQNHFDMGSKKKKNIFEKSHFKQSIYYKDFSKKNNFSKRNDFVVKPPFMQKCFQPNILKKEGFHISKCICHYCNKIGHFTSDCPIKRNMHFGAKMIWVPKTNHEGPKIKRVPNTT